MISNIPFTALLTCWCKYFIINDNNKKFSFLATGHPVCMELQRILNITYKYAIFTQAFNRVDTVFFKLYFYISFTAIFLFILFNL